MLLAAPDMHHTRIQGNKLWHLALVELWLQRHVDARVTSGRDLKRGRESRFLADLEADSLSR